MFRCTVAHLNRPWLCSRVSSRGTSFARAWLGESLRSRIPDPSDTAAGQPRGRASSAGNLDAMSDTKGHKSKPPRFKLFRQKSAAAGDSTAKNRRWSDGALGGPGDGAEGEDDTAPTVFGLPIEDVVAGDRVRLGQPRLAVPVVVSSTVRLLQERGLRTNGIFRVSGAARRIRLIREAFEAHLLPDYSQMSPADVAAVLKGFVRELPETIFTSDLNRAFLDVAQMPAVTDQATALVLLMILLPVRTAGAGADSHCLPVFSRPRKAPATVACTHARTRASSLANAVNTCCTRR